MNQKILDYIEKHTENNNIFNAWVDSGVLIANNREDVEKYLKHHQCHNITYLKHEIRWKEPDGTQWYWSRYPDMINTRGKRFSKIKIVDDTYDELTVLWIAIHCVPSPNAAEWEIIKE